MIFFPSSKHPQNPHNPLGGFGGFGGLVFPSRDFRKGNTNLIARDLRQGYLFWLMKTILTSF
jgi:hypothetical protein